VIFVDANVPMFLIGADHPHKHAAQRMLERVAIQRERLVSDAEVFQEILHRYVAIRRRDAIQPAFDALSAIVDEIVAIESTTVERAKDLVLGYPALSARDAVHVAVMQERGISRLMSFDAGFDVVPGLTRIDR
jgi:predicted nucleic acid-binding protein